MRYPGIKIVLLAFIVACYSLLAVASVSLKLQLEDASHSEAVFVKDLNLMDWIPASAILQARLSSGCSDNVEAYFALSFSTPQGVLLRGQSEWFTLRPGPLHLTNLDLTDKASPYKLTTIAVSALADDLMQAVKLNGYLPAGIYRLKLELYRAEDRIVLVYDELHLEIANPFFVDLFISDESRQPRSVIDRLNPEVERITAALRKILGEDYLKVMHNLAGYQPTATVRFNGEDLTLEELQALADRFVKDGCTIEAVFVQ